MSGESAPFAGAEYERQDDGSRHRLGRGVLAGVVSVILVGVLVGSATIAYQLGFESGASRVTPIITAGDQPFKVRPADPGGMKIPNQDKRIYEQLASGKTVPKGSGPKGPGKERLVRSGERPIESLLMTVRPAAAPPSGQRPANQRAEAENVLPSKVRLPPPPPPMRPLPRPPAGPLVIKDLTAGPKRGEKTGKPVKAIKQPPRAAIAPAPRVIAPAARRVPSVAALPSPPAAIPKRPSADSGRYLVQLSSAKSMGNAQQSWRNLRRRHPDLFDGLSNSIAKTYLGAKKGTWYRLRAGPFETRASARLACERAKKRKVACFVVRR